MGFNYINIEKINIKIFNGYFKKFSFEIHFVFKSGYFINKLTKRFILISTYLKKIFKEGDFNKSILFIFILNYIIGNCPAELYCKREFIHHNNNPKCASFGSFSWEILNVSHLDFELTCINCSKINIIEDYFNGK